MANFGALTDHFGILAIVDGEGTLATVLELVDSSATPDAQSRADAQDENGDIADAHWHGNTAGELIEASSTFTVKGGTLNTALLLAGEIADGKVITSVEVTTSNSDWPKVVVSGKLGTETIVAPTGKTNKWTFPAFSVVAARRAQLFAFTVDAACRLTGSSVSGSVELAQTEDGIGEPIAHGVSGGVLTMGAELVAITGDCAWEVTGDWTETQVPGAAEGQAANHTGSGAAELVWERDAVVAP